jgi:hypothetical protein
MGDDAFIKFKMDQIDQTKVIINATLQDVALSGHPLNYQFHEGANLLVVTGRDEEAMSVARKIINAMIGQPGKGFAEFPYTDTHIILDQMAAGSTNQLNSVFGGSWGNTAEGPLPAVRANTNATRTNH